MRRPTRHGLRRHWLCACATIITLYTLLPMRYEDFYSPGALPAWLELSMFLLTFPLGPLFMYNFYTGFGGGGERVLLWSLALAVGYVQWFHLAPALLARLRRPAVTTLNLAPAEEVAPVPAPRRAPGLADRHAPPVPPFDARGRTPLERIMQNAERKAQNDEQQQPDE